jgi:hypothetical protein
MSVDAALHRMMTYSFADWSAALRDLRAGLDSGGAVRDLSNEDMLSILRAYLWWRRTLAFADVRDAMTAAMPILLAHPELRKNPAPGTLEDAWLGVSRFLATVLDEGRFDTSGWKTPPNPPEVNVHVAAAAWADVLPESEAGPLRTLSSTFEGLYAAKHVSYHVLRHVGAKNLTFLEGVLPAFPPADQGFVLHALDGHTHLPEVMAFYQRFVASTPYPHLREEARRRMGEVTEG